MRRRIVWVCREAYRRGLTLGSGGNVSARTPEGVLITPHGCWLGRVRPEELLLLDPEGRPLQGTGEPSVETPLHLCLYRRLPSRGAVVHLHPPLSLAAGEVGEVELVGFEARLILRRVPVLPQRGPTVDDPEAVADALREHPVVILRGHGTVAAARTPEEALFVTELLERSVQVLVAKRLLEVRG